MDKDSLADFLRHRRAAMTPEDVGLERTARRRTPGLRREEVARLASMSVDYYTRLEQGRGPQPSMQMLAAITRALRLSRRERDHLHRLAGHVPPPDDGSGDHVSSALRRVLDHLDTPAMVTNDLGYILAQNHAAMALIGDESRFATDDPRRSRFHRWFLDPQARTIHPEEDCDEYSRAYVAILRAATGRRPRDPHLTALVHTLRTGSPEFARLWECHDVSWRPRSHRKTFRHPEVGALKLDCEELAADGGAQILLLYTAVPGSASADSLRLLESAPRPTTVDRELD
ncbi:helix-turn-helix transcriptional regulator [Williamsia deligens]|uniref:Helix-turn-helix transcriptional regulator n=1 Tax=Williamsia deligens TaxID=321325 RepID=A0ABW3G7Y1_9NOCA|nr:helix-turn-helix transcriptional regulator [Williamsia deligens]MCP2192414.1 Helix-turn-helix domain-containing protein [Williamsia deligens]